MFDKRYNILCVEADPWGSGLIEEALAELEERRQRRILPHGFQAYLAKSMEEALDWLEDPSIDLVLLDPELPDSTGLHSYLRLKRKSPDTPVVLVLNPEDEDLGISAVREGAQDYLLKNHLDCMPLARSIRYAIERQATERALRHMPAGDPLTGLVNRPGFLILGQQILDAAARWRRELSLQVIGLDRVEEIAGASGRQIHDLLLLEAAEFVRDLSRPGDLLGRVGDWQLALLSLEPRATDIAAECARQPVFSLHSQFIQPGSAASMESLLRGVECSLCENDSKDLKPAY